MPDLHLKSGGKSMVKGGTHLATGFRDFILRGNIVSGLIFTIFSCAALSSGLVARNAHPLSRWESLFRHEPDSLIA